MATKSGMIVTNLEGLLPMLFDLLDPCSRSLITVPMATKLGRMMTDFEGILPIKSNDPLVTWLSEITWQTKTIISPLPQCLCPPNLVESRLIMRGFNPRSHMTLWLSGLARSRDKLTLLYLHYHNTYENQTWQGGDLPWEALTRKVKLSFSHVVFWDHVTN